MMRIAMQPRRETGNGYRGHNDQTDRRHASAALRYVNNYCPSVRAPDRRLPR
jgi:hypothetical protein